MKVEQVPQIVTVSFFVLYFIITNLCLLNLFIAAILEQLKITQDKEGSLSEAAKAALVMKEVLEAEAAQLDLDNAVEYLNELQDTGGTPEEIAEAEQIAAEAKVVLAKEKEESLETMEAMSYFGVQPSQFALGCFGPKNRLRQCCQTIVHSSAYYWTVTALWACTIAVPCFKNKIDDFDKLDCLSTIGFAAIMWLEVGMKCLADGFLWTLPTVKEKESSAVYNMEQNPMDPTEELAQRSANEDFLVTRSLSGSLNEHKLGGKKLDPTEELAQRSITKTLGFHVH